MKLDMINTMSGTININHSSNNENIKSSNDFIKMFDQSLNKDVMDCNLLEKEEDKDLEALIMKLIEMMIKKSIEPLEADNLEKEIENSIEKILNLNKRDMNEIFNALNLDEYFHGNKEDTQEIINILDSIKKDNGIEEVNLLLEKLKSRLVINEDSNTTENISTEKNYNNLKVDTKIETLINDNALQVNKNESTSYIKANNHISIEEKINYQNDKDISILKEIAKDESSNFVINENRFSTNSDLNISTSKINDLPEVRTSHFTQDVMESINYLKNNNLQELKVNLNPKELGEITIKLVKSDKDTKLSVVVAKDEIYSLVNKNLHEITKHLESLDIRVNEISVDIKNNNQSSFSDNSNHNFKQQQGKKRNNYQNEVDIMEADNNRLTNDDNINLLA